MILKGPGEERGVAACRLIIAANIVNFLHLFVDPLAFAAALSPLLAEV